MALPLPILDDTDFEQLLNNAQQFIEARLHTTWSASSEGDPGRVLIEAFAYLTDQMIYRINRLPQKVYIAFLQMLGVTLHPPTAAQCTLQFTPLPRPAGIGSQKIEIARGTRISTQARSQGDRPVFVTLEPVEVSLAAAPGDAAATVRARHCTWIRFEELGSGSNKPGLSFQVAHPPIVASFHPAFDVEVWVQVPKDQENDGQAEIPGKPGRYVRWQEVPNFSESDASSQVYVVDRLAGTISFAPAIRLDAQPGNTGDLQPVGAVPPRDCRILVSYASGGGSSGNVLPGILTTLLDPVKVDGIDRAAVDYLLVTNLPATGGQDAETLDNALLRGPQTIYRQNQVVTTRDYARIVLGSSKAAIARARALAKQDQWTYARPGTVELLLVPAVPDLILPAAETPAQTKAKTPAAGMLRHVSASELWRLAAQVDLSGVRAALDQSKALGTHYELTWAGYKEVQVKATILVASDADAPASVTKAVSAQLSQFINPFYNPDSAAVRSEDAGWPFGRSLDLDEIRRVIQRTPGVERVSTLEAHFPAPSSAVTHLAADLHQLATLYASSSGQLYCSLNDGQGWELQISFPGETVGPICASPDSDGLLALATMVDDPASVARSRVYVSTNCGRSWTKVTDFNYIVEDIGWLLRANLTILLLATDRGLYEFALTHQPDQPPVLDVPSLVPVDARQPNAPIYSLVVAKRPRGQARVAVALKGRGGVFISDGADLVPDGMPPLAPAQVAALVGSVPPGGAAQVPAPEAPQFTHFRQIFSAYAEEPWLPDVRYLAVQQAEPNTFLWAGVMAEGNEAPGPLRWSLNDQTMQWFSQGWKGGSCLALAFAGRFVFAATYGSGVIKYDLSQPAETGTWSASTLRDNVPPAFLRPTGPGSSAAIGDFKPVRALAVSSEGTLLAGAEEGILRRLPAGRQPTGGDAYEESSATVISDRTARHKITLPYDWLFVSGDHDVQQE